MGGACSVQVLLRIYHNRALPSPAGSSSDSEPRPSGTFTCQTALMPRYPTGTREGRTCIGNQVVLCICPWPTPHQAVHTRLCPPSRLAALLLPQTTAPKPSTALPAVTQALRSDLHQDSSEDFLLPFSSSSSYRYWWQVFSLSPLRSYHPPHQQNPQLTLATAYLCGRGNWRCHWRGQGGSWNNRSHQWCLSRCAGFAAAHLPARGRG